MANEKNIELLKKFLNDKPKVSFEDSTSFPSEEKIYTIAGMKRFFRSQGLTNAELDEAFYKIQNDNSIVLNNVKVYNHTYKQSFPYFYMGEIDNLKKITESLENSLKGLNSGKNKGDNNLKKAINKRKSK
jgi:hypothetical protein